MVWHKIAHTLYAVRDLQPIEVYCLVHHIDWVHFQ
jgi:hypothetical protein